MEKIIDKIVFPKSWKPYYVSELGEVFKGKGISKSEILDKGLPCIRYGEIYFKYDYKFDETYSFINQESANKSQEIKYGDVLFTGSGETAEEIGKAVAYVGKEKAYAGGDIIILRPNEPKAGLFYGYLMNSDYVVQQKFQEGQGQSVVHIYGKSMQRLRVVLPPLPEQQKIAAILSKWDELIETQTKLIEEKEKQKKGLMQKLLTGEVRFPGFEEEWEEVELGEVAEFSNGKAHENIVDENGKYILITSKFISTDGAVYRSLNDRLTPLYKNDIVMVMSDVPNGKAIAKCYMVEKDDLYSLNQRIGRFVFNNHDSKFMFYLLNRNPYFLAFDSGVGQTNLRKDDILECSLLLPSISEQNKISSTLNAIDEEIQSLKEKLEAIKLQKKGLMQQLLTGKIRVKI